MKFVKNHSRELLFGIFLSLIITVVAYYFIFPSNNLRSNLKPQPEVGKEQPKNNSFYLEIPEISISAPIITGVDPSNEKAYNAALKNGVLLMPGTGVVGKPGNVFIYGHSSSDENGGYNKIFRKINGLENNDEILVYKDGNSFRYQVTGKKIVAANDLSVIKQTKDETITLMTCWPIGTDEKRLVVFGKKR